MADYRLVMSLLLQGYSYRQIEVMAACSHRTIAKANKVLDDQGLSSVAQVEALGAADIDAPHPTGPASQHRRHDTPPGQ